MHCVSRDEISTEYEEVFITTLVIAFIKNHNQRGCIFFIESFFTPTKIISFYILCIIKEKIDMSNERSHYYLTGQGSIIMFIVLSF